MKKIGMSFLFIVLLAPTSVSASLFGEENIPLTKLVIGQVLELEKLASQLEVAKEQQEILSRVNEGISRTISQIEAIEEIIKRAQGLDPKNVRRISDLTLLLGEVRDLKYRIQDVLKLKMLLTSQAVSQAALQSETSYAMGQEMIKVGTNLSSEAQTASPGRAAQISASAQSAATLSSGVLLQTLSHLAQIQAISLDLQKSQIERDLMASDLQNQFLKRSLQ